ncbi:MAG: hypothetical protein ABTQ29_13125, partial [Siculibacillus sp.]
MHRSLRRTLSVLLGGTLLGTVAVVTTVAAQSTAPLPLRRRAPQLLRMRRRHLADDEERRL